MYGKLALPSLTQGRSPVRELRSLGSVWGVSGNRYSYRDSGPEAVIRDNAILRGAGQFDLTKTLH